MKKFHFTWGLPNKVQKRFLLRYIDDKQPMSIYGDDGIYKKLESKIEQLYQVKYTILTNSGTSALSSAYFGININRNDEVIVPVHTFLATVTPLLRLGAVPVFVDADSETGNISPAEIEKNITRKTKAIVVTHMWGLPCEMDKIVKICVKYDLPLVEDCAHANLTTFSGKLVGTFGKAACFSVGAKKTLTGGEGGFLLTSDPEVYIRASLLGHFNLRAIAAVERVKKQGYLGLVDKYKDFVSGYGENYRMHPYAAVMIYAALTKTLKNNIKRRAEALRYFAEQLNKITGIKSPVVNENYFNGAMYGFKPKILPEKLGYNIDLNEIVKALKAEGVEMKLPDTIPLCDDPLFIAKDNRMNKLNQKIVLKGNYPGAHEYMRGRVSLPTFSRGLKDKAIIDEYCKKIEKIMKSLST